MPLITLPIHQQRENSYLELTFGWIWTRNPKVVWEQPRRHPQGRNRYVTKSPLVTMGCPTFTPENYPFSAIISTPGPSSARLDLEGPGALKKMRHSPTFEIPQKNRFSPNFLCMLFVAMAIGLVLLYCINSNQILLKIKAQALVVRWVGWPDVKSAIYSCLV